MHCEEKGGFSEFYIISQT